MGGPDPESFQRALKRFTASLDPNLRQDFSKCSLRDLHSTIRDIQLKQGKDGNLRHMQRLQSFLEVMDQFSKVIEVFLNVNELVCFIWGPIKFLLTITKTYFDIFDKLLDAYSRIGEAIPGLLHYKAIFEAHSPLAAVLEDYYSDVLNFHHEALAVFTRPRWKMVFKSTWKTFETKFDPILQSLARRRELLESEKGSASLYEIQRLRADIRAMCDEQKKDANIRDDERHRMNIREIKVKLQSPDYQLNQEVSAEHTDRSNSGKWIFADSQFQSWYSSDVLGSKVLYINGIPGAGKTTLMSTVIGRLLSEKRTSNGQSSVAYFYFKHGHARTHNAFLRAFLEQLITQSAALSGELFDELSAIEGENLRGSNKLQELVKKALQTFRVSFLVLDGLDECLKEETHRTVQWLLSMVNDEPGDQILRVIFSGQRDGVLDVLLNGHSSISLETPAHVDDIRHYCAGFCERIQKKFKLPQEMHDSILTMVTEESKGSIAISSMFLYNRVVARVLDKSCPAIYEDALKLLGLIISAQRPLRWREIQAFFCIDPEQGSVDYDDRLQVSSKELCGSLVDVSRVAGDNAASEEIIRIVHPTAQRYLIEEQLINMSLEHAKLAIFCSKYLTSNPFRAGRSHEQTKSHAATGSFALLDYTAQHWYAHTQACIESHDTTEDALFNDVVESLHSFFRSYERKPSMGGHYTAEDRPKVIEAYKNLAEDARERNTHLRIELRTSLIRQTIEGLYREESHEQGGAFLDLCGPKLLLKCPKSWCTFFTGSFETVDERDSHLQRHDRSFICSVENCFASKLGFESHSALQKHQNNWHTKSCDVVQFPQRKLAKSKALSSAAKSGDLETAKSILESEEFGLLADRFRRINTAMDYAVSQGHLHICSYLLSKGAEFNNPISRTAGPNGFGQGKWTAFEVASARGYLDVVKLFLSSQPRPLARLGFFEACIRGQYDTARAIFEVDGCDKSDRRKALEYSIRAGNLDLVKFLIEHGFGEYLDDNVVKSMLRCAYNRDHDDILELILSARSFDVSVPTLKLAIHNNRVTAAKMISCSPNFTAIDFDLSFAASLARTQGYEELAVLIEQLRPAIETSPKHSHLQGSPLSDFDFDSFIHS
ncbi:hypothetical protein FZEAL_3132 [Fusarium zealandicum]|uniref:NACHT domain-containing protein n=1 Tax=Fusarium zealandicum TaxID=1053134 RepID=A0A8H4XMR5_9HYPO|nr:hypothetical protein FZEAL_3132 [Fusarium zealandicum]